MRTTESPPPVPPTSEPEAGSSRAVFGNKALAFLTTISLASTATALIYVNHINNKLNKVIHGFADSVGVDPGTILGNQPSPQSLPGSKLKISPAKIRRYQESALVLQSKTLGPYARPYASMCSATRVSINHDPNYALTARHCIDFNSFQTDQVPPKVKAANVFNHTTSNYRVVLPRVNRKDVQQSVAHVTAISVLINRGSADDNDIALLRLKQTNHRLSQVKPLPISKITNTKDHPERGQPVAIYSTPSSTTHLARTAIGIYLGRTPSLDYEDGDTTFANQQFDLVAINQPDARMDPCEHGGSGSSARFATGANTGPAGFRLLRSINSENFLPSEQIDDPDQDFKWYMRSVQNLGVTAGNNNVICAYDVPKVHIFTKLVQGLKTPAPTS